MLKMLIAALLISVTVPAAAAVKLPAVIPIPVPKPIILTPYELVLQERGVNALWITADGSAPSALATSLRDLLLSADRHGLDPALYWTSSLENAYRTVNPQTAAAFEKSATAALMKYAGHLITGRVDPELVGSEIKVSKRSLDQKVVYAALKTVTPDLNPVFDRLAPRVPAYDRLRDALARLSSISAEQFPPVAAPKRKGELKIGDSDPVLTNVKIRLQTLGYMVSETGPVYTRELAALVKFYFSDHTMPGTPGLRKDSPFWKHLGTPLSVRLEQIRLTMEKMRWLPTRLGDRHLHVNLAFQRLEVRENGATVMAMKTINGRSKRKSPFLIDKVTIVELNPVWNVPDRLAFEDKVPEMRKDPWYLERSNYVILDRSMRYQINSWEIDWNRISREGVKRFRIQQEAGLGNALGVMKFHLTNPYAIYLHDTNERGLFSENHRLLSSGCVRLERPVDLAEYLLRDHPRWWSRYDIESNLATSKVARDSWPTVPLKHQISLPKAVPVYLTYFTADVDETGVVMFAQDFYEQDARLADALKGRFSIRPTSDDFAP